MYNKLESKSSICPLRMAASTTPIALSTAHALLCTSTTTSPTSGFRQRKVNPSWICCLSIQGGRTPTFPVFLTDPSMGSTLQDLWWRALSDRHAYRPIPHRHAWHRSQQALSPLAGAVALFQFAIWRNHFRETRRELGRLDKYPTMEGMQKWRP